MKKTFAPLYLTAILLSLALSSCEKVIEFNGDETENHMVMISKPQSDSPWKVRLTESRFFLSPDTIGTIKNAQISIEVNGRTPNNIITHQGNGVYDLGYTPQPGDTLTLRVTTPEKGTMMAGCRIPNRPVVSNISCTYDTSHYYDYYPDTVEVAGGRITVKLTIDDPADAVNYYMLRVSSANLNYNYNTDTYDTIRTHKNISVDDNVLFDMDATEEIFGFGTEDNYGDAVLFTDERINGQSHTILFDFWDQHLIGTIYVEVYTLSRDLYLYEKSLKATSQLDEFSIIFAEPVQLYCNVTGGIGILGGSAVSKIPID